MAGKCGAKMTKANERIIVFTLGVVFVVALVVLSYYVPQPTQSQFFIFKVVLALAASGIAAMMPGFVEIDIPKVVRAGGSLAVFFIVLDKSPAELVATPTPEPIKGNALLLDGFKQYGDSGFKFNGEQVVAWNAQSADILAAKRPGDELTGFFIPYDVADYKNPELDKQARSGIQKVSQSDIGKVYECPTSGYQHHWFTPSKDSIYCLRLRDGNHYALIQVNAIDDDRIGFDYLYQPSGTARFR